MATLYVARSPKLGEWGSDVGLSKHLYKFGVTDEPLKPLVAAGWAGETDWVLVKSEPAAEGVEEDALIARLAAKAKLVDPNLYPRLREATGIFKVLPAHVENHLVLSRALADPDFANPHRAIPEGQKPKPADYAAYLIHNAKR